MFEWLSSQRTFDSTYCPHSYFWPWDILKESGKDASSSFSLGLLFRSISFGFCLCVIIPTVTFISRFLKFIQCCPCIYIYCTVEFFLFWIFFNVILNVCSNFILFLIIHSDLNFFSIGGDICFWATFNIIFAFVTSFIRKLGLLIVWACYNSSYNFGGHCILSGCCCNFCYQPILVPIFSQHWPLLIILVSHPVSSFKPFLALDKFFCVGCDFCYRIGLIFMWWNLIYIHDCTSLFKLFDVACYLLHTVVHKNILLGIARWDLLQWRFWVCKEIHFLQVGEHLFQGCANVCGLVKAWNFLAGYWPVTDSWLCVEKFSFSFSFLILKHCMHDWAKCIFSTIHWHEDLVHGSWRRKAGILGTLKL